MLYTHTLLLSLYLCHSLQEHIRNSPFSYTVQPASTFARESTAFGQGLYHGIAGKSHAFIIKQKDRFGNFRRNISHLDELDDFATTAEFVSDDGTGLGSSLLRAVVTYNDSNKMYTALYVPRTAGFYQLNVTKGSTSENHIHGSPFLVHTKPGATFAPESVAFGGDGNCLPWVNASCTGPGSMHLARVPTMRWRGRIRPLQLKHTI